jgi:hypothetical protein
LVAGWRAIYLIIEAEGHDETNRVDLRPVVNK